MITASPSQGQYLGKGMLALSITPCAPQIHNEQLAEWMCVTCSTIGPDFKPPVVRVSMPSYESALL